MLGAADTETERQRIVAWRWSAVSAEVCEAWHEQQVEACPIRWGLVWRYVQAIISQAAWTEYLYQRGVWLQRPTSHDELREWRIQPEKERGHEPGPIRPKLEQPSARDLPVLTPEIYSRTHGPDTDAQIYLVACRLRAGLPVGAKLSDLARSRYGWARYTTPQPQEQPT